MTGQPQRFQHLLRWQLEEAREQRVLWILTGVALAVVLSGPMLRSFHFGADEPRFHAGVALLALWGAGTLLPALLAPVLVGLSGESRILHCLRARGVGNGEWVVGAFTVLAVVQGWLLLLIGAVSSANLVRLGQVGAIGPLWVRLTAQAGGLLVVCALAVMLSAIFRRATGASAAVAALGLAMQFEPLFDRMAGASTGIAALAWKGLDLVLPGAATLDGSGGIAAVGGAVGYCFVYLGMAAAIHEERED